MHLTGLWIVTELDSHACANNESGRRHFADTSGDHGGTDAAVMDAGATISFPVPVSPQRRTGAFTLESLSTRRSDVIPKNQGSSKLE